MTMDVNQVKFGSYSIGNSQTNSKQEKAKPNEVKDVVETGNLKQVSADEIFSAMDLQGIQNKAQVNLAQKREVNPNDYLTQDRIDDIEAMMGNFENGVLDAADTIDAEFPGLFKDADRLALAAQVFARE